MSMPSEYKKGKFDKPITYAVKHKNFDIRMASRSGGIFTALSDELLKHAGVVYGCVLTDDFTAVHVRAEISENRDKMRGSKYIQSEMRDIFKSVKQDLVTGKQVLFSGTSCQVAGLRGFLGRDYENLFCVDIVCHGVPSPMVWKEYLKWPEERHGCKIKAVDFRNKRDFGWKDHVETLFLENGKQINSKVFTTLFYGHSILRPCCYQCPYKDVIHPGNITIADYWGIDEAAPGFNDDKGVSLVLINDEKGKNEFDKTQGVLEIVETRMEDSMQPPLRAPYNKPKNRQDVWNDYYTMSFEGEAKKYGGYGFVAKVKRKIRWILKRK